MSCGRGYAHFTSCDMLAPAPPPTSQMTGTSSSLFSFLLFQLQLKLKRHWLLVSLESHEGSLPPPGGPALSGLGCNVTENFLGCCPSGHSKTGSHPPRAFTAPRGPCNGWRRRERGEYGTTRASCGDGWDTSKEYCTHTVKFLGLLGKFGLP